VTHRTSRNEYPAERVSNVTPDVCPNLHDDCHFALLTIGTAIPRPPRAP
jgi:hypothetical protein